MYDISHMQTEEDLYESFKLKATLMFVFLGDDYVGKPFYWG
jgi:hypothetical protein